MLASLRIQVPSVRGVAASACGVNHFAFLAVGYSTCHQNSASIWSEEVSELRSQGGMLTLACWLVEIPAGARVTG